MKWLHDALRELEEEVRLEEIDGLTPNWITRDDEESRRYDDFLEHSRMLNRGEDLRDDHMREVWSQYDAGLDLWRKQKKWEVSRGEEAYNEYLTDKYKAWWTATQRQNR